MDWLAIAAVAATVTLICTNVGLYLLRRRETTVATERIASLEGSLSEKGQEVERLRDSLYNPRGIRIDSIHARLRVLNLKGDLEYRKTVLGMNTSRGEVARYEATVGVGNGRFLEPLEVECSRPRTETRVQPISDAKHNFVLQFDEKLREGVEPVTFTAKAKWAESFYLTREEAAVAYASDEIRHDYHLEEIRFPTQRLEIEIDFGPLDGFRFFATALYGQYEMTHHEQAPRAEKLLVQSGRTARLVIDNPTVGTGYAVCWRAPSANR